MDRIVSYGPPINSCLARVLSVKETLMHKILITPISAQLLSVIYDEIVIKKYKTTMVKIDG